jgi:hypothetical protein
MAQPKTNGAAVAFAELGRTGTDYVKSSSQALKLSNSLLRVHEDNRSAALKKVAAVRELLVKTKLVTAGDEKHADDCLSNHEQALDVLANVLEEKLAGETEKSAAPGSLGAGVSEIHEGNGNGDGHQKAGRMVMHERVPRGHSQADRNLRDSLLR